MISNTLTRKFVSVWVAVAILMVYSVVITAKPMVKTGGLSVVGEVTVDGQKVTSGGTFFSDSTIITAADSTAILSLGKLGRIELLPNSSLSLTLGDNGISGTMLSGRSRVSTPVGVAVNIATKDGAVNVDGSEATSVDINTENVSTIIGTKSGLAVLRSGTVVNEVTAGENGVAGVVPPPQQFIARLTTTGNQPITVNGAAAASGANLLTGATIETPASVGATIDLGSLGELEIEPNTQLTLDFDHNGNLVKINLKRGCVRLRTKGNVNGEIETADGVKTKSDSKKRAAVCYLAGGANNAVSSGGGGLSGGAIAAIVVAIGGGTGLLIWALTKDDEVVSPAK
jgi:hypothetical protein